MANDDKNAFPSALFDWGNAGGVSVCRCSDDASGWQKPPLRTRLITQLEEMVGKIKSQEMGDGASIFLVGGPGNGKTHAAKYFQKMLLGDQYAYVPADANGVVEYPVADIPGLKKIRFIEDASAGENKVFANQRFVEDIESCTIRRPPGMLFICCVNRGILANVLARVAKKQMAASEDAIAFISRLSAVVSPDATPISLWPLAGSNSVFVHPMDEESLLEPINGALPIAAEILAEITDSHCEKCQSCACAGLCPMLSNLQSLRDVRRRDALLKVLRYYEITASKMLSFRDLFSIFSLLIVGKQDDYVQNGKEVSPCAWVERHAELAKSSRGQDRMAALFELELMLYHNRLFSNWKDFRKVDRQLMRNIKSAKCKAIAGTYEMFRSLAARIRRDSNVSSQSYLENCAILLDPALQETTQIQDMAEDTAKFVQGVEDAYCKSLSLGVETFLNSSCSQANDIEIKFLRECGGIEQNADILDMSISDPEYSLAQTTLSAIRIVLARISKRSMGAANAFVLHGNRLNEFRRLLIDANADPAQKRKICRSIQNYLFPDSVFCHSMLATFGQSVPDAANAFFLKSEITPRFALIASGDVAAATKNLLFVKESTMGITIKVNFDLYSALIDLQDGMSPASLPERIYDIFDGAKARIQGCMCHHWDENARSFCFPDRDNVEHRVSWSAGEGFFEDK